MFTGIVADLGSFNGVETLGRGKRISLKTALDTSDFTLGESIAVNGVCLTVDAIGSDYFAADVSPETLKRSNLGGLRTGEKVNLERALLPTERLGGHFVLGHVDGQGAFAARKHDGEFEVLEFTAPAEVAKYLVAKGSVTVDGVSLTVAARTSQGFTVAVIPHTLSRTTLSKKGVGEKVNLEADILGKYVEKLLGRETTEGGLTMETLAKSGFLR